VLAGYPVRLVSVPISKNRIGTGSELSNWNQVWFLKPELELGSESRSSPGTRTPNFENLIYKVPCPSVRPSVRDGARVRPDKTGSRSCPAALLRGEDPVFAGPGTPGVRCVRAPVEVLKPRS